MKSAPSWNLSNAIYLDVKQFTANQRQGTHKSKERSEISGSTRKIGRQKGGGNWKYHRLISRQEDSFSVSYMQETFLKFPPVCPSVLNPFV